MKKLKLFIYSVLTLAVILLAFAFFYVAFSSHRISVFDIYYQGRFYGTAKVDEYITEDKIVYKCRTELPYTLGYPLVKQKLVLKRKTMMPLSYFSESRGSRGMMQSLILAQSFDKTDVLFLKAPLFFRLEDFETGERTTIFSPHHVMMCLPVVDLYNFWKKGAQFFEVMIPIEEPMPVLRDKVEMRYLGDEYVPAMGRRYEAERYVLRSKGIHEVFIGLAGYNHSLLYVDMPKAEMKFVLKDSRKEFENIFNILLFPGSEEAQGRQQGGPHVLATPAEGSVPASSAGREVFFESEKTMLSGKLWLPQGEGAFTGVVLVHDDGPMTNGEELLFKSLGKFLSDNGLAVLDFDNPGEGKSPGQLKELDDTSRIRYIAEASSFLTGLSEVKDGKVVLMGLRSGGYLGMKAAENMENRSMCVMLGMPVGYEGTETLKVLAKEGLISTFQSAGLGEFDDTYLNTVLAVTRNEFDEIRSSDGKFSFFMGKNLPLNSFREFLSRDMYGTIARSKGAVLVVFGNNDVNSSPKALAMMESLRNDKAGLNMAVFRNLGPYIGKMEFVSDRWLFEPNKDVLDFIATKISDWDKE